MKTRVVQVVPRVPPSVCGVGDYAWQIALEMRWKHDIESAFIFCDPLCAGPGEGSPFECIRVEQGSAAGLADLLENEMTVVLHLSGYGYASNGAPAWIGKALEMLRGRTRKPRVITMFHELFATGPIISRAFWTQFAQRRALRRICRASDIVRTNRREYAKWLARAGDLPSVLAMPVISNFGENATPLKPSRRDNKLVLFQPPSAKSPFWDIWRRVDALVKPVETIVAGRARSLPSDAPTKRTGLLSKEAADRMLNEVRYVMVDYYAGYLGKSGIFASVAAHGAACILACENDSSADGIHSSVHYLTETDLVPEKLGGKLDDVAAALHDWYKEHCISATADSYVRNILDTTNVG